MKQFMKYSCLVMLACLTALTAQARVHTISVTNNKTELSRLLRNRCKSFMRKDTVVLNFAKGEYNLDGTIEFTCNVVIRGAGAGKSTIIMNDGSNNGSFKAFTDDSYLKFHGVPQQPISVDISDISFKLKDHKGLWWYNGNKMAEKLAIKIYHANHVDIRRVNSYLSNAPITNFDLRVCSNVTITDCVITNYNNCDTGGNLWFRGEMHNVNIKNNKIFKYGNDEAIAFFNNVIIADGNKKGSVTRSNIIVENNELYYGYEGKDKDRSIANHMLFNMEASNDGTDLVTTTRNVQINNNKFYINDECHRCIRIKMNEQSNHHGIIISGNEIINKDLHSSNQYYRNDIELLDLTADRDTIHIIGNNVSNMNAVLNPYKTVGYSFLLVQGSNVNLNGNKIVSKATTDPYTGKETGVQLVWCGANGGSVTLTNNVCKGVKNIATVGAGDGTKQFTLKAFNNYFAGDTRVYCHKIERLDLNFTSNTIVCNNMHFFLQEFARKGTVIFNNNDVTVSSSDGRFMTHYNKTSTDDMKFERLEVTNNVFHGVKSEQDMFKNITNVKKRTLSINRYIR